MDETGDGFRLKADYERKYFTFIFESNEFASGLCFLSQSFYLMFGSFLFKRISLSRDGKALKLAPDFI